jgi:formamidopyrimidine-DNA glycosylase
VPELLEIEYYRRLAERALHRPIASVSAPDGWYLKGTTDPELLAAVLVGHELVDARRVGKLLLLDTDDATTVGLRFGMTGVLEVDDDEGVDQLEYSSRRRDPAWVRFALGFVDGGELRLRDARRLGGVEVEPDVDVMGVDAMAVSPAGLGRVLEGSRAPLKARLMDQHRLAGLGNLLADEILWRSRLDPARPAGGLEPREGRRLHRHLRTTLDELLERGGSHTGDLMVARTRGGRCPRCDAVLDRRTIGGRTTYSCPVEQR